MVSEWDGGWFFSSCGPFCRERAATSLLLVVLQCELELANGFIDSFDGVFAMAAEVMGRGLKLSFCFLQLANCAANMRMALASPITIFILGRRHKCHFRGWCLRHNRSGKKEGEQHCNRCANYSFHELPPKGGLYCCRSITLRV